MRKVDSDDFSRRPEAGSCGEKESPEPEHFGTVSDSDRIGTHDVCHTIPPKRVVFETGDVSPTHVIQTKRRDFKGGGVYTLPWQQLI